MLNNKRKRVLLMINVPHKEKVVHCSKCNMAYCMICYNGCLNCKNIHIKEEDFYIWPKKKDISSPIYPWLVPPKPPWKPNKWEIT